MAVPVFRAEKPVNADVKITEKIAEIKAADKMAEFKSFWSNFWRSSSSLELKYPFPTSCHYRGLEELCIPVMVNRDQLSSIMAHALASKQYYTKLKEKLTQILQYENPTPATAQTKTASPPCTHMMLNWTDHGTFTCLIYFSAEFHLLRRQILGENADEIFIRSLASSADWATKGGKSKSAFCKTIDNRFVLKEMKSIETEPIDQFCPAYFQHIMEAHNKNEPSALARIFGIFYVAYSKRNKGTKVSAASISDAASGGPPSPPPSSKPMYQTSGKVFMVMENLFYGHDLDKVYDLKGNTTNRTMKEDFSDEPGEIRVYLDNNLQIHRISNPLLVNPASTNVLPKAVERDTMFLADANIMDYSLLVGVTKDSGKNPSLVIGIIDFMRKFTHDKYLENIVKENLLRAEDPTIVSPEQYKKRFMRIIPSYFDAVPDSWSFLDMAKLSRMSEKCVKKGEIEEEWRRRENERGEHGDAALC